MRRGDEAGLDEEEARESAESDGYAGADAEPKLAAEPAPPEAASPSPPYVTRLDATFPIIASSTAAWSPSPPPSLSRSLE